MCVIKHWLIHNYIRGDRLKTTVYQDERAKITLKNNNVYSLSDKCQTDVSQVSAQVRLGKVRIGEDSKTISRINALDDGFLEFWNIYPKKVGKDKALIAWKKKKPNVDEVLKALQWQKESDQWTKQDGQFIPNPATYINEGRWKDEPVKEGLPF